MQEGMSNYLQRKQLFLEGTFKWDSFEIKKEKFDVFWLVNHIFLSNIFCIISSKLNNLGILLKIKVLHDAIEEPFCVNGSIKNL